MNNDRHLGFNNIYYTEHFDIWKHGDQCFRMAVLTTPVIIIIIIIIALERLQESACSAVVGLGISLGI